MREIIKTIIISLLIFLINIVVLIIAISLITGEPIYEINDAGDVILIGINLG